MNEKIAEMKLVPVVALPTADAAEPLADALTAGGLPCAEVTLRTDAALESIKKLADRKDFLLGAGTVHSVDQAKASVDAGAKFVVMPGINVKTVTWCLDNDIPVYPGVATPTDLETALDLGLEVVKFFPAETLGGIATLKAFHGPYHRLKFIPTGGIGPDNVLDYLKQSFVLACGGSWMVKPDLYKDGDFSQVAQLTATALEAVSQV